MYDIVIIGAGVVGNACARELSRYKLRILVLEREPDFCGGTSGRNSGVLHAGFNNRPGSKMARFCVEGNRGFDVVARELSIPFRRTGKLIVGFDDADRTAIHRMIAQGERNGCEGIAFVKRDVIRQLAPELAGEFAMYSPRTGVLNPFAYTIALAENAHYNGVEYRLSSPVSDIRDENGAYTISMPHGTVRARYVVNAAGHGAARLANLLGRPDLKTYPCRGEYILLDRRAGKMLALPAYPVPNPKAGGLGIHLTPTVDGNILIGPSNEYIGDGCDHAVTAEVLEELIDDGRRLLPGIDRSMMIRTFAGVRPKLTGEGGYHDFIIERTLARAVNLVGIESPGLTAALPIARYVAELLGEVMQMMPNPDFSPHREGFPQFAQCTHEEKARLVARDPAFGEIVCRCETITRAEVLDAIRRSLGARTVAGVKNRCRASMGRCQGGYCGGRIAELLSQERQITEEGLILHREGSYLFAQEDAGIDSQSDRRVLK